MKNGLNIYVDFNLTHHDTNDEIYIFTIKTQFIIMSLSGDFPIPKQDAITAYINLNFAYRTSEIRSRSWFALYGPIGKTWRKMNQHCQFFYLFLVGRLRSLMPFNIFLDPGKNLSSIRW